ncbi:Letm1 protein [Rutstroemia sp. NJR-2017a WRK4]|nr:Letm1 protein [Rutstroemia sp. NJR-2017a WRK4]
MATITMRSMRSSSSIFHTPSSAFKPQLQYLPLLTPRYQSSSTTITEAPSASASKVNGPSSTLPATLSLPVREPNQPFFFKYAISLGKAYAAFYKTGVKNIYHNFIASQPLQELVDTKHKGSISAAVKAGDLSRSDFQLLVRNWHDVKRIPAFALVFIICGEFTPLVVVALSSVVPWTCRIPKQIDGDRKKLEERRKISFRNLTMPPPDNGVGVEGLERMQLLHISWSLGLRSSMWDWLGGQLPGLPNFMLRRKLRKRLKYLELDDELIRREGGVTGMDDEEIKMACVERGIDVVGRDMGDLKTDLKRWLRSVEKVDRERLFLTRPNMWPAKPDMK